MAHPRLRILGVLAPPLLLFGWLWFCGSYSWLRDVAAITVATVGFAAAIRRRRRRSGTQATSLGLPPPAQVTVLGAFAWLVLCWIAISAGDILFRPPTVQLRGTVTAPYTLRPALATLRIGLALSGGGYRAALVHAGVLQELAAQGIPVTNLVSVSGDSIIAAFVARGGDPADFVDAVKTGRFRLKRELMSAFNLPRWIIPVGRYSRRDVQASIIRHVLLANDPPATPRPSLMVAMTDLVQGLSIGATGNGLMLVGPTTERFFRFAHAIRIEGLADQSDVVAVSGAFPGAFSALHTSARLTPVPEPIGVSHDTRSLMLALVDGGVRDNLGLRLLQGINREARRSGNNSISWPGFTPDPEWALDLIIVSDGGQSFEVADGRLGLLAQIQRAIDLSGLETGILRAIQLSDELPIIPLSIAAEIGLSPDAVIVQSAIRSWKGARRDTFQPLPPDDPALARIVELLPTRGEARTALAGYRRTRGPVALNIGNLDERCSEDLFRFAQTRGY
jgi:hypothetical protein